MARTSYVSIPAGMEEIFLRALKSGDRFTFSKIVFNDTLLTRRRKAGIRARSLLPQIAAVWNAFSGAERAAWSSAAAEMSLNGWQLFVQDQTIRILNEMAGTATPATLHQSWVGALKIAAPATEIKLAQFHPQTYWLQKKVYGKKGMYTMIPITESFGLPLTLSLNYKADLTAAGGDPFAKFFADVLVSYQGADEHYFCEIALDFSTAWKTDTATISVARGTITGYTLYFHLHDLTGELYVDDISAYHNAQNWVRDPFCKSIATTFTKQWVQIPMNWVALVLPAGAEYDSVYLDF